MVRHRAHAVSSRLRSFLRWKIRLKKVSRPQPQLLGVVGWVQVLGANNMQADTFIVDESWLTGETAESSRHEGPSALADREIEMIEAALAESHG